MSFATKCLSKHAVNYELFKRNWNLKYQTHHLLSHSFYSIQKLDHSICVSTIRMCVKGPTSDYFSFCEKNKKNQNKVPPLMNKQCFTRDTTTAYANYCQPVLYLYTRGTKLKYPREINDFLQSVDL